MVQRANIGLRALRTFCVAARHESFRTAGEELFITASAVSHQIKNLEDELGVRLFERQSRSIVLTDAGRSLFDDLQPLIRDINLIVSQHKRAPERSVLRISVQPFFASELFVPNLQEFTALHPEIDIKVDTSDESTEKHPSSADVSIRVFKSPPDSLASDRLFSLELIPVGSPRFHDKVKVHRKKIISDFPLIVHESRPNAWRKWSSESGVSLPENSPTIGLDSMIAVARAAEKGLGAALIPAQLSKSWLDSGALEPLFDHKLVTREAYYFVCREEDRHSTAVKQLRDWALKKFDNNA